MIPSPPPRASIACCSRGVISWLVSAVVTSVASSRRSMTRVVTVAPRTSASAATRCAVRSASSLVEEGSEVPALTTTRFSELPSGWLLIFFFLTDRGGCQLGADRRQLVELGRGELGAHGARDRAGVPPADAALQRPAVLGQREPDGAQITAVGDPLHQPAGGQPVDQPGQGGLAQQHVLVEVGRPDRVGGLG